MPDWIFVGLDAETFYCSKTYTLRQMDVPSYICDPRYEDLLTAVKINGEPNFTVDAADYPKLFSWLGDPSRIILYGHNLMFDACLFSWRHNWRAGMNICTLALSRQLYAKKLRSLSLDSVSKYLGLPPKLDTIVKVDGLRAADIRARGLWPAFQKYAGQDIDNSYGILLDALPKVSVEELVIADNVLRLATEPVFELDQDLLAKHYTDVIREKQMMLAAAMAGSGLTGVSELMSNDKFAAVLESLGVDPPTKISPTTGKETWAFAKSDDGMKELQEHDDPAVQAVVAARLGHKSTQEETRTARLCNIATLKFPAFGTGLLPVPLKVSGAHTHRLSGEWKLNCQNFKRNTKAKPSKLRHALRAPKGHVVVVGDLSQIEARMSAKFSGQEDLVKQFADGLDAYCIMGTKIFGRTITKADEAERFCSKTTVLSGMYGVGPPKFRASIKHLSKEQTGKEILLSQPESEHIIYSYRRETAHITRMRDYLNGLIPHMANPACDIRIGPVRILHNRVEGPGGLCLYYDNLMYDERTGNWVFQYQQRWKRLYGGKFMENIIQFLARCVVMQAWLRLRRPLKEFRAKVALQAHDELALIAPAEYAWRERVPNTVDQWVARGPVVELLQRELTREVSWMPGLPVACEIGVGPTYGAAK